MTTNPKTSVDSDDVTTVKDRVDTRSTNPDLPPLMDPVLFGLHLQRLSDRVGQLDQQLVEATQIARRADRRSKANAARVRVMNPDRVVDTLIQNKENIKKAGHKIQAVLMRMEVVTELWRYCRGAPDVQALVVGQAIHLMDKGDDFWKKRFEWSLDGWIEFLTSPDLKNIQRD